MFIKLMVLRKNIKNLISFNYIKKALPLFLFSCVYYNTFYNAEVNYEKAEKIIQETAPANSDNEKIPSQAKKLLGKAIKNSNIVIDKYPNSKYVDDAYFIIGKASFLRNEFFNAEKYFKKLNTYYPGSEYSDESKIWLAYTYLKMDSLEVAKSSLNELQNLKGSKYQYLINNIFAEISVQEQLPFNAYSYYNKSLLLTNDKSQKTSIYLKLLDISKKYKDLDSTIVYLTQLSEYTANPMKKEIKLDWIKYNRKAGNFNDLLVEIDKMLGQSEYSNIYIKLELEKAKVYLDQKDFESAKIFFTELSDKYSRKSESAEALYQLGYIALLENFDLDLSLEYFEKSKKDRKTSLYGKHSRNMINRINDYKNILQELEVILSDDIEENIIEESSANMTKQFMPKPNQKDILPDSLLFVISEKLLFDFDQLDYAKVNYERLINEYPESKFRPQSLYVLNFYFPDQGWGEILDIEYPNSQFNLNNGTDDYININNFDLERDEIWKICEASYSLCAKQFLNLYNQVGDSHSLYFYAFINDNYLSDMEQVVEYYKKYIDIDLDLKYNNQATSRLNEIEDNIYSMIEWTNQKINYYNAIEALRTGKELDSVLVEINKCIEGSFSNYKSSGQLIKSKLNKLISLNKQINTLNTDNDSLSNSDKVALDSLYFVIGKIYQLDFMIYDSANYYYKEIANNSPNSKLRYGSILALNNINSNEAYLRELLEYPDSIRRSDSSYKTVNIIAEIDKESFIKTEIGKLELLNSFTHLFEDKSDTVLVSDTININMDSINNRVNNAE